MLKEKELEINISNRNIAHYKEKGYDAVIGKNLTIDINDLLVGMPSPYIDSIKTQYFNI